MKQLIRGACAVAGMTVLISGCGAKPPAAPIAPKPPGPAISDDEAKLIVDDKKYFTETQTGLCFSYNDHNNEGAWTSSIANIDCVKDVPPDAKKLSGDVLKFIEDHIAFYQVRQTGTCYAYLDVSPFGHDLSETKVADCSKIPAAILRVEPST